MGDLIDEGSEADDQVFADYAERFHGVYPAREGVSMVYIPGDNDIGGEGADPVTINKMDRYLWKNPWFRGRNVEKDSAGFT